MTKQNNLHKQQRRFTLGLCILAVLAVALLGVISYIAMHRTTQQSTQQATFDANKKVVANQKSAAMTMVKAAYTTYAKDSEVLSRSDTLDPQSALKTFIQHTTPAFGTTLLAWTKSYDPVLCSQNTAGTLTYGDARVIGAAAMTAAVTVTNAYANDSIAIEVDVDTTTNKIAAIECPGL
jgi:hypothetical protein